MIKLLKKVFGTNGKTFIFSFAAAATGIFLNFFLARIMTADKYGDLQYLVSLASTISSFLVFGFLGYTVREAANKKHIISVVNKVYSLFFIICVFSSPIVFFLLKHYLLVDKSQSTLISLIVLIVSIVMGINSIGSSYLQGTGKYHKSVLFENFIPKFSMLVLSVIFFVLNQISFLHDLYIYFYFIIYGIAAIYFLLTQFKTIDIKFEKDDFLTWLSFFGGTITFSVTSNLTKIFQKAFFDNPTSLAIISVSLSIISLISVFNSVVLNICKPIFASQQREGSFSRIIDTYRMATRVTSYIAIPFYIFLLTQGNKFLSFFGDSYTVYPLIIVILAIRSLISEITGPSGTLLIMVKKEKTELVNGIINLVSFVICAFIFKYDGIYGMCFSLLISTALVNALRFAEIWYFYKTPPFNIKTIIGLMVVFIFDFVCIFFLRFINTFWIWLVISLPVGIVLIIINFFIGLHKKDFKEIMEIKI